MALLGNDVSISISTSDKDGAKVKKSDDVIGKKILPAVCALLNCDGGTIKVDDPDAKLQLRSIEQRISNMIGGIAVHVYVKIKPAEISQADCNILIFVKKSPTFITIKYNLYVPTEEQIIAALGTDRIEDIKRVLHRCIIEDCVVKGSHLESNFIHHEPSRLRESDVTQFKSLETKASKSNTFVTRMLKKKTKFSSYISGFANHRGGHIYFGIDDEGVVTGENISEKEKQDVIKKVTDMMNNLTWTEHRKIPEKGVDWEIYFEEVKDGKGGTIDSTYVVVVFVAVCRGGVFTDEPESYYIKGGKVERMNFDLWCKCFNSRAFSKHYIRNFNRITWSSKKNMNFFIQLSERLVDHRDAGEFDAFKKLCTLAVKQFKERNAELVVKAGEITIAYKSGKFEHAKKFLNEFEELLCSSKDRSIFEVRLHLSQSLVERSKNNYKVSYEKSKEGLQLAQNIPPGLCLLWLYLECAMNAACLGFENQDDANSYSEKKREALLYLEDAARVANTLIEENIPYRITDFQHKLRIYKAWVLINCSVTGDAATIVPSLEDVEAAEFELSSVFSNQLKGNPLTKFREIEYFLVKSDYFKRCSEFMEATTAKMQSLQDALDQASIASQLAEKDFKNLFGYAGKRCEALKERIEFWNENSVTQRTFEGIEY